MSNKIIGYKILPINAGDDAGMIMTAALNCCFITGRIISSMGGGMSSSVVPEVMEVLKNDADVQALIRQRVELLKSNTVG